MSEPDIYDFEPMVFPGARRLTCLHCRNEFSQRDKRGRVPQYCSTYCRLRARWLSNRDPLLGPVRPRSRPPQERFWSLVDKSGDCWNWRGSPTTNGYGRMMTIGGLRVGAHRISWTIHNGPIPDGLMVCHRCDNPRCVRPDHLFLGTAYDNNIDSFVKGRRAGRVFPRSGIPGVTWSNGRWRARLSFGPKTYCLGIFDTPTEAAYAVSSFREHVLSGNGDDTYDFDEIINTPDVDEEALTETSDRRESSLITEVLGYAGFFAFVAVLLLGWQNSL